jgi:aspartate carbamoyltransferase catalytic subunit
MRHFTHVNQMSSEAFLNLAYRGLEIKKDPKSVSLDKLRVVNMFFENSTRTKMSFEMAEYNTGCQVLNFDVSTSSVAKGESLYDSVLTMKAIGNDIAVIRHSDNNFYEGLMEMGISIVNAGSGSGEHPSQSLLDLMTIVEEFQVVKGLKVMIVGDLKHSRVANSNAQLLNALGAEVYFVGPDTYYDARFEHYGRYVDFDEALGEMDVVMLLRIQFERHEDPGAKRRDVYLQEYGLNTARYGRMKETAIIMHPAPVNRGVEIADSLVESDKSRIVRQMENGVFARIAILEWIKGRD